MATTATARDTFQADLYRNYGMNSRHEIDPGVVALPLADSSPTTSAPVEFITLYQPTRRRIVSYSAIKNAAPPMIPTPQDNANEIFMGGEMNFPLPRIDPGRSGLLWSAFGEQEFIDRGAWTVATGFRIGDFPSASTPAAIQAVVGAVGGLGAGALALDPNTPENFGNQADFSNESNAFYMYDFNTHFPSKFCVDDLAVGG